MQLLSIKEGIPLKQSQDLQSKVMLTLFSLFAEIEPTLISLRTKEALASARASAQPLGRPRAKLGSSKLDGKQEEIQKLLKLNVSKSSIAKITGVDRSTLYHFLQSRKLSVWIRRK